MIDALAMKASQEATRSGDLVNRRGIIGLSGASHQERSGVLTFPRICPTMMTRWMAAEVIGHFAHDSVRVRFTDGTRTLYLDSADLTFKDVSDTDDWDEEWSTPSLLNNLDLWTAPSLGLIIQLVRTDFDRDPQVVLVRVLMDLPTWAGSVAHVAKSIVAFIATIEPVLIHTETASAPITRWHIGAPYSEQGFDIRSLVQLCVDGDHKSATYADGVVTVVGDPIPAGSTVELAVKYRPQSSVRRVAGVRTLAKVPAWVSSNLVTSGGMNGMLPRVSVGGYEIDERRIELRVNVSGLAERTENALEMRAALQRAFVGGLTIELPSGRSVTAQIDGFVEVIEKDSQMGNLPMAAGTVMVAFVEYVGEHLVRRARDDDGAVITTSVELDLGIDVDPSQLTVDIESFVECDD